MLDTVWKFLRTRQPGGYASRIIARMSRILLAQARGVEYPRLLLRITGHARVTPAQLNRIEKELSIATLNEVLSLFPKDRMLSNFVLNMWELAHGCSNLKSLPWNISLPIADVCNARCTFCTSWITGRKQLALDDLERFEPVLRTAIYVGLVGHGEPLAHPQLDEIADRLGEYLDPRAASYTITNGVYLRKWFDKIDQLRLSSISCSLNAATPETHREVMGLPAGEFPQIVETLTALALKSMAVSLTLVVTRQNLAEIPAFIELGHKIKASSIYLRTLLPQGRPVDGLNYHLLPPYLHPDFESLRANAISAIKASTIPVHGEPDTWSSPVFPDAVAREIASNPPATISREAVLHDKGLRNSAAQAYEAHSQLLRGEPNPASIDNLKDATNPQNRRSPFRCRAPYNNLYVNELFLRLSPCCYMTKTPEHDEIRLPDFPDVTAAWNAKAMQALRRRLDQGPLYGACERCPISW